METMSRKPISVVGRVTRVEQCACGNAVVLVVGPVSLRLELEAARDVAATLAHVLALLGPEHDRSVPSIPPWSNPQ